LTEFARRYYGVSPAIRHPRHLNVREFQTDNFVVLGSRLSVPWVELFEATMNYPIRIDPETRTPYLENRAPSPGEAKTYRRSPSKDETYVDIALLPGPGHGGNVLIFNAIDMLGVEAAVEFAMNGLVPRPSGDSPRYKETLLRVRSIGGTASKTEIVAVRALQTPGSR
jgi:hypothetical protein